MSPHAHARIRSIDTSKAAAADGVLCVLTGKDAAADGIGLLMPPMPEDVGGPKGYRARRPLLAADKVRAVGDRVAFVVAETLAQAQNAAELIEIDYEMLPAVTSVEDAVKPGAPAVWDECPGNVSFTLAFGNKDATDAAFAKATHKVSLRLESNRSAPTPSSRAPRSATTIPPTTPTRCYATSQNPHGNRSQLAGNVLKIPETQTARDLARRRRRLRHEVRRLSGGRAGAVGVAPPRPAGEVDLDALGSACSATPTAATRSCTASLRSTTTARCSGCASTRCTRSARTSSARPWSTSSSPSSSRPGVYDIPALHAVGKGVFTNTGPVHPYRGAGRPEATYLIERLLDRAAAVVGIDPVEIRRRNFIAVRADAAQDADQHHLRQRRLRRM